MLITCLNGQFFFSYQKFACKFTEKNRDCNLFFLFKAVGRITHFCFNHSIYYILNDHWQNVNTLLILQAQIDTTAKIYKTPQLYLHKIMKKACLLACYISWFLHIFTAVLFIFVKAYLNEPKRRPRGTKQNVEFNSNVS